MINKLNQQNNYDMKRHLYINDINIFNTQKIIIDCIFYFYKYNPLQTLDRYLTMLTNMGISKLMYMLLIIAFERLNHIIIEKK